MAAPSDAASGSATPSTATGTSTPKEHDRIANFRTELASRGGEGEVRVLPDSVHTAQLAADALGCEVGAIANSLLFVDAQGEPVLLLTSGAHRVNTDAVPARMGLEGKLKRASAAQVKRFAGQVIGGVSPIAHPAPIRTWIDGWLRKYPVLWAAAGHPAAVYSTSFDELQRMTGAVEIDVE
ncbi:uncharacterized protein LOC62_02G002917 [Vanrija pseudolonga]|uniref:YbaK/aminoacyl-tRNA synthetase-associated domain-containing protein n=1 Tax=Vanrija pseudolonga TaxID=143232 RepID=A0AAF1BKA7_9TREE|nr:hypothetical protein LOC62_02G002917 [Vanrija pseudolonga]